MIVILSVYIKWFSLLLEMKNYLKINNRLSIFGKEFKNEGIGLNDSTH